ncbi:Thiol-specific monooxygenase [Fusarium oxysporum f. sp. albedinis]|nr:Thiol-specific monooxygenase [Fusarium oxysporum f. sp. albedinis]
MAPPRTSCHLTTSPASSEVTVREMCSHSQTQAQAHTLKLAQYALRYRHSSLPDRCILAYPTWTIPARMGLAEKENPPRFPGLVSVETGQGQPNPTHSKPCRGSPLTTALVSLSPSS